MEIFSCKAGSWIDENDTCVNAFVNQCIQLWICILQVQLLFTAATAMSEKQTMEDYEQMKINLACKLIQTEFNCSDSNF